MTVSSSLPFKTRIFADGANAAAMVKRYREGFVRGFTTNPTLMAKAGIHDYASFAREVLAVIRDLPISFEVFSDDFAQMERQALLIASWGSNVNVKIPITNTNGDPALPVIQALLAKGVKLNVTAILAREQWLGLREVMRPENDVIVSIFAGRIADTGVDPVPMMTQAVKDFRQLPKAQVLWASPREALNIYQAEACGCHIITATDDLISKVQTLRGKSLAEFSLETVRMFHDDARKAGFQL
jgi:transaldolase